MIKDVGGKFENYSISTENKQISLHWGYELTEKYFFIDSTNRFIKMSYYRFNRNKILQKAKERYSKEKAAEHYLQNKESIKEKSKQLTQKLAKRRKRQN